MLLKMKNSVGSCMVFLNFKKVLAAIVRSKETKALSNAKLIKQSKYEIASPSARNHNTAMSFRGALRLAQDKLRDEAIPKEEIASLNR